MSRPRGLRLAVRMPVLAGGLAFFLACGVLTALLGAAVLDSRDYTVFAAFSGLVGVLLYGPGSSLEQEATLRAGAKPDRAVHEEMRRRAVAVWLVTASLAMLPLGWQPRLLGDSSRAAVLAVVLTGPVVLILSTLRGVLVARSAYAAVATSYVIAGMGTVLLPLLLVGAGLPRLAAFLFGPLLAWIPALAFAVTVRARATEMTRLAGTLSVARGDTVWIITVNLLVLGNLLAVPPLLRWHVEDLDVAVIADSQVLVSVSRLSTTLVVAALPLLLALRTSGQAGGLVASLAGAVGLGTLAVAACALLGDPFLKFLTGRPSTLPPLTVVLAALPVVLLCPALVLMAVAMAQRRHALLCGAWGSGLVVLALSAALEPNGRVDAVLIGVLAASALPLLVTTVGVYFRDPLKVSS